MNRQISIIGILQVLVIVLGFIVLGIHMKFLGYASEYAYLIRWSGLAVFLREYGLFLLLVPLFWTALAIFSARRDAGVFSYQPAILIGIAALILTLCAFLYAGMNPGVRRLLIFAPAPSPTPRQVGPPPPANP